jgi:hypothetical protein
MPKLLGRRFFKKPAPLTVAEIVVVVVIAYCIAIKGLPLFCKVAVPCVQLAVTVLSDCQNGCAEGAGSGPLSLPTNAALTAGATPPEQSAPCGAGIAPPVWFAA